MNTSTLNKNIEMLNRLEKIIGNNNYEKVVDQFAGKALYFPRKDKIARKYEQIRREYTGGAGFRDLADRYQYTETHIRRILRGQGKKEPAHEGFFPRLGRAVAKCLKKTGHSVDNGV
jgi:Mor family transcriptional regulator